MLVRCYRGLGDAAMFIRYAPLLKAIAGEVIVWAQPAVLPLLRTARGIDRLLPLHDGTPERDDDLEVMELPHAFRARPRRCCGQFRISMCRRRVYRQANNYASDWRGRLANETGAETSRSGKLRPSLRCPASDSICSSGDGRQANGTNRLRHAAEAMTCSQPPH